MYRLRTLWLFALLLLPACSSSPTAPTASDAQGVGAAPNVTQQPTDLTVRPGRSATLRIGARGAAPLTYQWYRGVSGSAERPISGATSQEFTTPVLPGTTRYWARVSNPVGVADSATATITVEKPAPAGSPPSITLQPADRTIAAGKSTLLKVRATGTAPLRYQWYRGPSGSTSRPVTGATSKDYTTPHLTQTMEYWARISNPHGTLDSATATVTVNVPTPNSQPDPESEPEADPEPNPQPQPEPEPEPEPDPEPEPEPDPDPVDTSSSFEQQVVTLVNQHRSAGATCGGSWYPPVDSLSSSSTLRNAARDHSADMAMNSYFSHTSLDGTTFDERIRDAGYNGGSPLGENIAAGMSSPQSVVNAWMGSSGHCKNIMKAGFEDIGVGYAHLSGSPYRHYWTQDFGGG